MSTVSTHRIRAVVGTLLKCFCSCCLSQSRNEPHSSLASESDEATPAITDDAEPAKRPRKRKAAAKAPTKRCSLKRTTAMLADFREEATADAARNADGLDALAQDARASHDRVLERLDSVLWRQAALARMLRELLQKADALLETQARPAPAAQKTPSQAPVP